MINALHIHPNDDVAVVTQAISKGDNVVYGDGLAIVAVDPIPIYHKIALHDIRKGEAVHKYNNIIGESAEDIHAGQHVHVHNIKSMTKKGEA